MNGPRSKRYRFPFLDFYLYTALLTDLCEHDYVYFTLCFTVYSPRNYKTKTPLVFLVLSWTEIIWNNTI